MNCPHCDREIDESLPEHMSSICPEVPAVKQVGGGNHHEWDAPTLEDAPAELPEAVIAAHDRRRDRVRRIADWAAREHENRSTATASAD